MTLLFPPISLQALRIIKVRQSIVMLLMRVKNGKRVIAVKTLSTKLCVEKIALWESVAYRAYSKELLQFCRV